MSGAIVTERPVRTAVLRNGWDDELFSESFEACERSSLIVAHERGYAKVPPGTNTRIVTLMQTADHSLPDARYWRKSMHQWEVSPSRRHVRFGSRLCKNVCRFTRARRLWVWMIRRDGVCGFWDLCRWRGVMGRVLGSVRQCGRIGAQMDADKPLRCPHRRDQRGDAQDVHDAFEIIGQYVQRHFRADPFQRPHQEVGVSHP